ASTTHNKPDFWLRQKHRNLLHCPTPIRCVFGDIPMTQISIQPQLPHWVKADISVQVSHALEEDIGSGDITAELIPADANAHATLITREDMVLCGQAWVEEIL